MFITINKDGSVYIQSSSFIASYDKQGKLNYSFGGMNAPKSIRFNDNREKQSENSLKEEIATLSIKISVDSTDLDKLEAQLKRIEGLMVSAGLKQSTSVGFSADMFIVKNGQVFIDEALIPNAKIQGLVIDDALRQAVKEGARKGAEQVQFEITTGINDNHEQSSAEIDAAGALGQLSEAFSKSTGGSAMTQAIRINTAVGNSEFEKFKQQVESELGHLHSSIAELRADIQRKSSGFA